LPAVSFIAGVPGHSNTANYTWEILETVVDEEGIPKYSLWSSTNAYEAWYPTSGDTVFKGLLFDLGNDEGVYLPDNEKSSLEEFDSDRLFMFDHENHKIILSTFGELDPNNSSTRIGFIYPWALRPKLISRESSFDFYDYGPDLEEWTEDDDYVYYGANAAESHFIGTDYKTDWHASTMSRINTHQSEFNAEDVFKNSPWISGEDTYPILAHSGYSQTWPKKYNEQTGLTETFGQDGGRRIIISIYLVVLNPGRILIAGRMYRVGLFPIWMYIWNSMTAGRTEPITLIPTMRMSKQATLWGCVSWLPPILMVSPMQKISCS